MMTAAAAIEMTRQCADVMCAARWNKNEDKRAKADRERELLIAKLLFKAEKAIIKASKRGCIRARFGLWWSNDERLACAAQLEKLGYKVTLNMDHFMFMSVEW